MKQLKIAKQITNRESESLERYLQEIARVDLIQAEDEVILSRRIKEGDEVALEKMVKANLRFVVSVAKQYQHQGLSLSDLISEGNLGLIKAAQRFDETRGFKFISYAVWWIRQSILQSLAEHARIVRLPLNRIGTIRKITRAFADLEQKYEREPTPAEVAESLEMTPQEIQQALSTAHRSISMDAPFVQGEEHSMIDVLEDETMVHPEEKLFEQSLRFEVDRVLNTLTQREREVIVHYFGLRDAQALTLEEIGQHMGLTRERVRQIKEKAVRRLRHSNRNRPLKSYME